MTWQRTDDKFPTHPKRMAAWASERASVLLLWHTAALLCASANTAVVRPANLKLAGYLSHCADVEADARVLVDVGLWHDSASLAKCASCKTMLKEKEPSAAVGDGAFVVHEFFEHNLTREEAQTPDQRFVWARKKRLDRDTELQRALIERDRGRCRYCDRRVTMGKRGASGGTFDHVNPWGENTLENLVVACRPCNTKKGDRTPAEAGMELLDLPTARLRAVSQDSPETRASRDAGGDGTETVSGRDGDLSRDGSPNVLRHVRDAEPDR